MKYLRAVNRKAAHVEERIAEEYKDVFALQSPPSAIPTPRPHYPPGCSLAFSPGWETDVTGSTAGLCAPVERDLYDCYLSCYWPAQVPDHLNSYPSWVSKCASATKDWRNIDLVFP